MNPPEFAKYRRHLEHFSLREDQKDELVQMLWRVAEGFADRAFGLDPVRLVSGSDVKNARVHPAVLEFEKIPNTHNSLTDTFRLVSRKGGRKKK